MSRLITAALLAATLGALFPGSAHAIFMQTPEEQSDGRVRVNWIGDGEDQYTLERKQLTAPDFAAVDDLADDRPAGVPAERPLEYMEASPLSPATYVYRVTAERNGSKIVSNTVEIDLDFDADGVRNLSDNCALANPAQTDGDGDGIGDPCEGPDTYDDFVAVGNAAELKSRIESAPLDTEVLLFLPKGDYLVDNPITIDRTARLVVQGENMLHTNIGRTNCGEPLFVIEAAGYVNFANVNLRGGEKTPCTRATNHDSLNGAAILAQNTTPIHLEIQESMVTSSMIEMRGPGTLRSQNVIFHAYGRYYNDGISLAVITYVDHAIFLDHPGADFFGYGGGGGGGGSGAPALDPADFSLVRQKRGRVRTFMFQTGAYGASQFELRAPSTLGAHQIAAGRNERSGMYGFDIGAGTCNADIIQNPVQVRVPSSLDRVDVVVKGHTAALKHMRELCGFVTRLVDYSAAGRLWLLANAEGSVFDHLATGSAPSALVLAAGNFTYGDDILPIVAESKATSANIFNQTLYYGVPWEAPQPRLVDADAHFAKCGEPSCAIAPIPEYSIPMPLDRPQMDAKLPGMLDVTDVVYGAIPNDGQDDTAAIQAAFDAAARGGTALSGKGIYLPSGTYDISAPLYYVHGAAAPNDPDFDRVTDWQLGGWIAGAGSADTFIVQSEDESVFATEGARFMTFQGITYKTTAYRSGGISAPNVSLDNDPAVGGPTNTLFFYDSHFDGGDSAVGIVPVLGHGTMGSEIVIVNSKFSNARTGVYIPSTGNNAMMDAGYNVEFDNLESAIETGNGSFYLTYASITRISDIVIDAGGGYPYQYFYGVTMDASAFIDFAPVWEFVIVENSTFTTASPNSNMFALGGGGGFTFLRSDFLNFDDSGGDTLTVGTNNRAGYAINLHSQFTGWKLHSKSLWTIDRLCISSDDADGDAVPDCEDNCLLVENPSQYDADGDGIGNQCDGDYDQDDDCDGSDYGFFRACYDQVIAPLGGACDVADHDGDSTVSGLDFISFRGLFSLSPGPSGRDCADPYATDACP